MRKIACSNLLAFVLLAVISVSASAMSGHVKGPNRAPVARSGFDQVVEVYRKVVLDGSWSYDPDGDKLAYQWELLVAPRGAKASLSVEKSMKGCFVPDKEGIWLISLTVTDGRLKSIDVLRVTVRLPEPLKLSGPVPARPDFKITEIAPLGLDNKKVGAFLVKIENMGADFSGSLDFRIVGLDRLTNGRFTLDRRKTVNEVNLRRGEKKWLILMSREFEWPEEVRNVTFAVISDPDGKISELLENNNSIERTLNRFDLWPRCGVVVSDTITINGRRVRKGTRFSFPIKHYGTAIGVNLINFGVKTETVDLSFVYDWTPLNSDGENIVIRRSKKITLEAGKERFIRFEGLRIPRKKKYKTNYTTFAILRPHRQGYDVLFETPVTADYVKIVGK